MLILFKSEVIKGLIDFKDDLNIEYCHTVGSSLTLYVNLLSIFNENINLTYLGYGSINYWRASSANRPIF